MSKRSLVLGGGGTIGIAWETGVAAGLLEGGIDLSAADLIVGTSAGSVVGTMLAFGMNPRQLLALQQAGEGSGGHPARLTEPDTESLQAIFGKRAGASEMTPAVLKEVGEMALAARTIPEEAWLGTFAGLLGGIAEWPHRPLQITAVDVYTGEFRVWDRKSGVPLHLAVASSCTVPGLFPPVTIGGSRYMDGGVRSGTNADLAAGCDRVLMVAPMGTPQYLVGHRALQREVADLRARGVAVEVILPDEQALTAFGPDLMDGSRLLPTAEAGVRQGRALAESLAALWSGS